MARVEGGIYDINDDSSHIPEGMTAEQFRKRKNQYNTGPTDTRLDPEALDRAKAEKEKAAQLEEEMSAELEIQMEQLALAQAAFDEQKKMNALYMSQLNEERTAREAEVKAAKEKDAIYQQNIKTRGRRKLALVNSGPSGDLGNVSVGRSKVLGN